MNEIVKLDFYGTEIIGHEHAGEPWFDVPTASRMLGYQSNESAGTLFRRHQAEFLPHESVTIRLTGTDGKTYRQRAFSLSGLDHLAILAKTEVGVKARRWCLDMIAKLRSGARVVTESQLEQVAARIEAKYLAQIQILTTALSQQHETNMALAGVARVQASNAGRMLAYIAHSPEARRAIAGAAEKDQRRFEFPGDLGLGEDGSGGLPANGNGNHH